MILVEHAVVVTMDPTRRIFLDGSVLVDGERIVQVGQARDVRPPMPPPTTATDTSPPLISGPSASRRVSYFPEGHP